VQLAVPDVDGDDLAGAALQQAVGETTRRGTGVERPSPVDPELEPVERGIELLPASSDEARRWTEQLDGLRRVDLAGRLRRDRAVDEDPTRGDVVLGALS
jgi:hypothetical protein